MPENRTYIDWLARYMKQFKKRRQKRGGERREK